ncbi:hypothetical protein ACHQM5_013721 [Ranunculus cassubicifolius]
MADEGEATTSISTVHPDVINTHILTRLDGPSLACLSSASSQLHSLSNDESLWTNICHSTWPSTDHPRMREIISGFPNGPRSFFSKSFPLLISSQNSISSSPSPVELISSVDVHYKETLIFSKVQETETDSGWFRCSPFRIDLLDPKDIVLTPIESTEDPCKDLLEGLRVSWIIVNPKGRQAANLSSWKPVSVTRHWLTNDIQVRFATILSVDKETEVQCGILVSFGIDMQVKEMSLQVEDMDGVNLNGKDSLGILMRGIENGERKMGWREGKLRYEEYLRKMIERKERNLRREGRLDALCITIGVSILACFWMMILST